MIQIKIHESLNPWTRGGGEALGEDEVCGESAGVEGEADVEGAAEVVEVALEEAAVGHACNGEEGKYMLRIGRPTQNAHFLQGCSKMWASGCVKLGEKVAFG